MKNSYAYTHSPIEFYFKQSPRDFVVEEVPLYEFSGEGAHTILKVRKKHLTTFELIDIISSNLGIKSKDIGYAGLKDKNALTIQHISIPSHHARSIEKLNHENIKILDVTKHNNKIKVGHLKGNNFFIRIKKLNKVNSVKIEQALGNLLKNGIPNYFGYQRFGINGDNYKLGMDIVHKNSKFKNRKMSNFLISAYQSYLFNKWLSFRVDLSKACRDINSNNDIYDFLKFMLPKSDIPISFKDVKFVDSIKMQEHIFKLLDGDLMCHYPHGKYFVIDDISLDYPRFFSKDISVTGPLSGKKMEVSSMSAKFIEDIFLDNKIFSDGSRRYAWIFPQNIEYNYKEQEAHGEFSFYLPKGAYATNFLCQLSCTEIVSSGFDEEESYV